MFHVFMFHTHQITGINVKTVIRSRFLSPHAPCPTPLSSHLYRTVGSRRFGVAMDRPVMDPGYVEETRGHSHPPLLVRVWRILKPAWRVLKIALRVLVWNPLTRKDPQFRNEDGAFWQRVGRGLMYRIAFVPLFVAIVVAMFVWAGTHPRMAVASVDPAVNGVFFQSAKIVFKEKQSVDAWMIPLVDARKILEEGEQSIRKRYPAVVLAPDCGRGADQVLHLIKPLHDSGFVVLALNSPSTSMVHSPGVTFGLRESEEVAAAVNYLRQNAFVDPKRIAVYGIGGGANAALLAACKDSTIRHLVLDRPHRSVDAVLREYVAPTRSGLQWMQPLCKWGFELGYQVDAEDLDFKQHEQSLEKKNVLEFSQESKLRGEAKIEAIQNFLMAALSKPK